MSKVFRVDGTGKNLKSVQTEVIIPDSRDDVYLQFPYGTKVPEGVTFTLDLLHKDTWFSLTEKGGYFEILSKFRVMARDIPIKVTYSDGVEKIFILRLSPTETLTYPTASAECFFDFVLGGVVAVLLPKGPVDDYSFKVFKNDELLYQKAELSPTPIEESPGEFKWLEEPHYLVVLGPDYPLVLGDSLRVECSLNAHTDRPLVFVKRI